MIVGSESFPQPLFMRIFEMPRILQSLTLVDARQMIEAGLSKASSLGLDCAIAIVDSGGHLLSFQRHDSAMLGIGELAINKAITAALFKNTTETLGTLAQPQAELYGITHAHGGKLVVFGGGIPVKLHHAVIGAVGVSGGAVAQDIAIANAAMHAMPAKDQ